MRLTSIAAGILTLALAGYPALNTIASRAAAAPRKSPQGAARGPMSPEGSPPRGNQTEPSPQVQQQPPDTQNPLQIQTTVVNVFATVRDRHNAIVGNLTKDDFKVYEDGVEQKVAYFEREVNMPISLAIMMDTSGSMHYILGAEKDAGSRFVREVMHKKDEAIVMTFDTDVNLLADFTEDPAVLAKAIHRAEINVDASGIGGTPGTIPHRTGGGTNLYDAIYLAAHDELGSEAGRKALVILSDCEDNGSKMSERDAIESVQRGDAVAHIILISDPGASEGYGPGVAQSLAQETGGRVINVRNDRGLEQAFDVISEELRSQYVLGYYPANSKRDGTFRKIKVETSRPDAKVLARRGYYAPSR
jgi:VWFA-related protein